MNRAARIGLILLGIVALLLVAVAITAVVTIRRPFPQQNGRLELPGLTSEVEVIRDEYGVPHIYADNEYDLMFAQGYVHAQDRFWQMEFWRHISSGRISEIIGEPGIDSDKFIRTMGWNRIATDTIALYEEELPELYAHLEAYSDGVNAYIEQNRNSLSVNHTILGIVNEPWEIEPWTPYHSVAWSVVMADDLSGNWSSEVSRANLIKELGASTVANLQPFYPYDERPVMVPSSALELPTDEAEEGWWQESSITAVSWDRVSTQLIGSQPDLGYLGSGPFVGSNNWVISGEHTDTGLPLLANDPHLGIQMPSIWYEVGLHAPGWDVAGFSFAGVPGVIVGHNEHIAWGVTNVGPDVQDLFIEKINPSNPNQYEFEGEWLDMEIIDEVISVNGGEPVELTVRLTHHGPIITELVDDTTDVLSMRWTAQEPNRILNAVVGLNQAENYDDYREALRFWDVPSQNVIYADIEGNIAYQMPSLIPIRKDGNGLVPVPGWTGEYEWDGWIPYEELPHLLNPEWGYIVTANHAVVDEEYPYLIDLYWADGDRGQRITDLIEAELNGDGEISIEDMARIQFDSASLLAASYIPLMEGLSSDDNEVQAALERLRGWDQQVRRDSVPAALFEIFRMQLAFAMLSDDVGEENVRRFGGAVLYHQVANDPNAVWWDDSTTATIESREDILLRALEETIAWFEENQGGNMNDWTWGELHTATFVSNPLGASGIGPIENLVNLGPEPVDGGSSIVNANGWSWGNPAAVTGHVSMRMIIDMSDFDNSLTVLPTGQSGHPTHPNYQDMFPLWQTGAYHSLWWSREAVEAAAANTLILAPPGE